jgi:hypothetical protein
MNMLDNTGETAEPYEQCWIMRSARRLVLVGAVSMVERRA